MCKGGISSERLWEALDRIWHQIDWSKMKARDKYLIADARHPLISTDKLWDEMLLYNIREQNAEQLKRTFWEITGKEICESSLLQELSGGQKVILMALLALLSPASRIMFIELELSLDAPKLARLKQEIVQSEKEIIFATDNAEDS
jgi:hypothetical protein